MPPPVEICCHNIGGTWIGAFKQGFHEGRVFSPYITDGLATAVLESCSQMYIEVYTRFDLEAFAARASSLKVLRNLVELKHPVYDVPGLHAKVVEHRDFASIGSQNLTAKGTRNREASVVVRDPMLRAKLGRQLDRWVKHRRPITIEMIDEAERLLPPLTKLARQLQRMARTIQCDVFAGQRVRDESVARQAQEVDEKELKDYQQARHTWLERLGENERNVLPLCRFLVAYSTQWFRQGKFVSAGRHCARLQRGPWGIELPLGENRFLVELALSVVRRRVAEWFSLSTPRDFSFEPEERDQLINELRGCVAQHGDRLASRYRIDDGDRLVFGTQFINTREFIDCIEIRASRPMP